MSAKAPAVQNPTPVPAAPTPASPAVQNQVNAAQLASMSGAGQRSTILTGPMGLPTTNTTAPKTLLGS